MTRRFCVPLDEADELSDEVVFLPDAGAGDWARIFGFAKAATFHAGDPLVFAGETDRALYFLIEGRVRVVTGGAPVKAIDAPSVLGEIAFLDGGPRSAGLVAVTDGELARLDMDAYEALADEDSHLARRIALDLGRITALRLRSISARERYSLDQ